MKYSFGPSMPVSYNTRLFTFSIRIVDVIESKLSLVSLGAFFTAVVGQGVGRGVKHFTVNNVFSASETFYLNLIRCETEIFLFLSFAVFHSCANFLLIISD